MENNYQKNYDINQEKNKLIIIFYDEDEAFNFTRYLNSHKHKNSLLKDMSVNLALTPNDNYNKNYETIKNTLSNQEYDIPRDEYVSHLTTKVVTYVGRKIII